MDEELIEDMDEELMDTDSFIDAVRNIVDDWRINEEAEESMAVLAEVLDRYDTDSLEA